MLSERFLGAGELLLVEIEIREIVETSSSRTKYFVLAVNRTTKFLFTFQLSTRKVLSFAWEFLQ